MRSHRFSASRRAHRSRRVSAVLSFSRVLLVGLALCLAVSGELHAKSCVGILGEISKIELQDFNKKDKSIKHIVANSLLWLFSVDAARWAIGLPSFDTTFVSNTTIDATATAVAHQVSMGNVPKKLKKYIEGRENYKRRTWINTSLAVAITLPFWAVAAANNGAPVDDAMAWLQGDVIPYSAAAMVFGLTYGIYKVHPYTKDYMFRRLPMNRDKKEFERLKAKYPKEMKEIEDAMKKRAEELGLYGEQGSALAMTLLELARGGIAYEEQLPGALTAQIPKFKKLANKIKESKDLAHQQKHRKKLVKELLKLHSKLEDGSRLKTKIEDMLALGAPFSKEQSLDLHRSLTQHQFKQWSKLSLTAFIDQAVWVGFAGGVVFRAITEFAVGHP